MATSTLGVKVDESVRQRLRSAAAQLGCTAHWLHKQALMAYLEAIEKGQLPADIRFHAEDNEETNGADASERTGVPFSDFARDVQPQSTLKAAISSAYRRPEAECLPMLLEQARVVEDHHDETQELATRLITALREKGKGSGVEGLVHEFSLSSQEGVALM